MSSSTRRRTLHILISSGPTREPIDAVRFLSNYSTGFMGVCVAQEARRRGHRVTLVSGPTEIAPPPHINLIRVESARQMQAALRRAMPHADVLIMAAAVSDFRPVMRSSVKLARQGRRSLRLEATPDIVAHLPRRRGQLVVGFALEAARVRERAARKLRDKRLDLMVGQRLPRYAAVYGRGLSAKGGSPPKAEQPLADASPARGERGPGRAGGNGAGSPFGRRRVEAVVLYSSGRVKALGTVSKPVLARALLDEIEQLWYGQHKSRGIKKAEKLEGLRRLKKAEKARRGS